MRKIYISKDDLIQEIEMAANLVLKNKQISAGPFTYLAVILLCVSALLFIIPLIVVWFIILLLYIPGYILDYYIVKYFYKRKN